ncbi:MAG: ferrous iron transport protein A [Alphaproteobacteria bacterium]|nr:ferrous iron transport protein A [Alphaproteobacteria bacterium]
MKNIVDAIEIQNGVQPQAEPAALSVTLLGAALPGFRGYISGINTKDIVSSCTPTELERRLLEMGFVEGHAVEVLHQGAFRGDPIAVRVGSSTVALRRREAMAIIVA